MQKNFQITGKVYWEYAHSWWKANPTTFPLKHYWHMPKLRKFSTNEMNLKAQAKETWKKSPLLKYVDSDKKRLCGKKTGSLTNVKVYNSRSEIVVVAFLANLGNPTYCSVFWKKSQFEMNIYNKQIKCPIFMKCVPK